MGSATSRSVIMVTSAPAGSGKTYVRCARFIPVFFRDGGVKHISNFPIKREAMRAFLDRKGYLPGAEFDNRVVELTRGLLNDWEHERGGPWEYFREVDLTGCHIALDEAHNVVGRHHSREWRMGWASWLGEIRHRGATIEFLSQDPSKLASEVLKDAAVRLSLVSSGDRRDPYLHVPLSDWYEVFAKLRGKYVSFVWCVERRKNDGMWEVSHEDRFLLQSEYFELYDSFSLPTRGGVKVTETQREWQKRSWPSLLGWFGRRNADKLAIRGAFVAFVVWLCFFGGVGWCMGKTMSVCMGVIGKQVAGALNVQAPATAPASRVVFSESRQVVAATMPATMPAAIAATMPATMPAGVSVAYSTSSGGLAGRGVPVVEPIRLVVVVPGECVGSDGVRRAVGDEWDSMAEVAGVDVHERAIMLTDGRRVLLGCGATKAARRGGARPASGPAYDDAD